MQAGEAVRGFFLGNLGTKAVALALAMGIWFYVGLQLTDTTTFYLPFTVRLPSDAAGKWTGHYGVVISDKPLTRVQPV